MNFNVLKNFHLVLTCSRDKHPLKAFIFRNNFHKLRSQAHTASGSRTSFFLNDRLRLNISKYEISATRVDCLKEVMTSCGGFNVSEVSGSNP